MLDDPDTSWKILLSNEGQKFDEVPQKRLPYQKKSDKERYMRIACISDTHGRHNRLIVPPCDVLIHAGDLTMGGELGTLRNIIQFFAKQPAKKGTVFIAGNHDITLQPHFYENEWKKFHRYKTDASKALEIVQKSNNAYNDINIQYLEDSFCSIDDVCIYGSPWQPEFCGWAFNKERTKLGDDVWSKIPSETDVLVTHGPPLGRGDLLWDRTSRVGCVDLLREVQNRILPRLHIFGHIHESYGLSYDGNTLFVNASSVSLRYQARNDVIVIDLPLHDNKLPAQWVRPQSFTKSCDQMIQWIQSKGGEFTSLLPYLTQYNEKVMEEYFIKFDDDLMNDKDEHWISLCEKLGIQRNKKLCEILFDIIMHLTAESFGTDW